MSAESMTAQQQTISAFLWLLRREWLEAKTPFFWFPIATLAVLLGVGLLALLIWGFGEVNVYILHVRTYTAKCQ